MELQVFNSAEFGSVRTATVNGEVMFVGKDVADILGYQNGSRDINRHVDEEDGLYVHHLEKAVHTTPRWG